MSKFILFVIVCTVASCGGGNPGAGKSAGDPGLFQFALKTPTPGQPDGLFQLGYDVQDYWRMRIFLTADQVKISMKCVSGTDTAYLNGSSSVIRDTFHDNNRDVYSIKFISQIDASERQGTIGCHMHWAVGDALEFSLNSLSGGVVAAPNGVVSTSKYITTGNSQSASLTHYNLVNVAVDKLSD